MKIVEIIKEINLDNGTNYKIDILKKYSDNDLFRDVLAMTYDKAKYTYGITMKNINISSANGNISLWDALSILRDEFCTRAVTWHNAIQRLEDILNELWSEDQEILSKLIDRDLKMSIGVRWINKVFKGLITKPVYMRCGIFSEDSIDKETGKLKKGTSRHITINEEQSALIQLKADWTYREVSVDSGNVSFMSRSGEDYSYVLLEDMMCNFPDGKYIWELEITGCVDRAESNGIINSDNIPYDRLLFSLWDYITFDEYNKAKNKEKCSTPYIERFNTLTDIVKSIDSPQIQVIETYEVTSINEALKYTSMWMSKWLEGAILKDKWLVFKDGTSNQQLKLKLEIEADVRITWFTDGKKGTSRESTFWAMTFETDDGQIKGQTSWFTDDQLKDFNSRREELIGQIIVVQFNDLTKWRNNDYYALSHPRFEMIRTDKQETDTLERVFELRDMAMNLSNNK